MIKGTYLCYPLSISKLISIVSTSKLIGTGKRNYNTQELIRKPKCTVAQNSSMGAIDKCDVVISSIKSSENL